MSVRSRTVVKWTISSAIPDSLRRVTTELALLSRVSYRGEEITGPRLRGLLALLASDLRAGCGTPRLVEGLWPDEWPENPTRALAVLVSRARSQLGTEVIARTPTGYRLSLSEDQVDASAVLLRASASARYARSGDHAAALAHAEAGLAFWDGPPGDDSEPEDPVATLRAERVSAFRSLARVRALALSRLGRHGDAFEALAGLAGERSRDEEVLLELLRCEAATVGAPAALARYEAYRRALRAELGTNPGPALQTVHRQLLRGASPPVRHGVSHEPNRLLGRADDLAAVAELLRTSRVTSIVGPGGLGKTRVANAVSREAEQRVVHLVALAGVADDSDVVGAVAAALGVGEPAGLRGIVDTLEAGPALLVLDNCEHVGRGAAELVRAVVAMAEDVRVLTTSRAPLGLSSESVYLLPELDLPTTVELFGQRARAARPGVELAADAVAELCGRLDGLPLAVELAAARVRVMSVPEITRHLDDRFALLRGGVSDAPQRHHTLHAVVDWSWHMLEPAGRAALRALSVFPGGFTADAARHLLGDAQALEHLVDQSLLKVSDTGSGARFRMLETVREFSAAKRDAAGETDRVANGFLAWARDFGVAHHDSPFGTDPVPALDRIRAERDNLAHALRRGLDQEHGATVAAASAVLGALWTVESNHASMMTLAGEASHILSHFRPEPDLVEVARTAVTLLATNTFVLQGPRVARPLATLRRLPPAPPDTLIRAGATVLSVPDPLALCDNDEPLLAGIANGIASYLWDQQDDLDNALRAAERMLEAFDQFPLARTMAHSRISDLCLRAGQGARARRHLRPAMQTMEELGAWSYVVQMRWGMVLAALQVGDIDEAEHWLERTALDLADETIGALMPVLGARAEILLARGEVDAGLRMWRRATDRLRNTGSPVFRVERPGLEPWALETEAAAVIAHAHHDRLGLVADIVEELPDKLTAMLTNPTTTPPAYLAESPVCGALLLALATVDLRCGAAGSGARLVALAERFRFLQGFQPTMSADRARRDAERAGGSAYADAVSRYADLGRTELRATALAALQERATG